MQRRLDGLSRLMLGYEMSRYFFNLTTERSASRDEEGEDFSRLVLAKEHALRVANELSRNRPPASLVNHVLSVVDERRTVVFEVRLGLAENEYAAAGEYDLSPMRAVG
jgi:hypothetical protein